MVVFHFSFVVTSLSEILYEKDRHFKQVVVNQLPNIISAITRYFFRNEIQISMKFGSRECTYLKYKDIIDNADV
jgi:hypothetical protein